MNIVDIGNWCSIGGLLVSVGTLFYARSIKSHVMDLQNRVLYNVQVGTYLDELKDANYKFVTAINGSNKQEVKLYLKSLETNVKLISRIVPKEQKTICRKCSSLISKQYKGKFILSAEEVGNKHWWTHVITCDDLYYTYIEVTALIDTVKNLKLEKDIIS